MKIAFPVQRNEGLRSPVYGHFGSAPVFVIVDTENEIRQVFENADLNHGLEQCQPMKALGGNAVDAIVAGGIGAGALRKLEAEGIKVFRAVEGDVEENLKLILAGKLPVFLMTMTCAGHQAGGGCHH